MEHLSNGIIPVRNPTFTEIIKFSNKVGFDKVKKVKEILSNDEYDHNRDYYSQLRTYILNDFNENPNFSREDFLKRISEKKNKRENYKKILKGFDRFKKSRVYVFFKPPAKLWKPDDSLEIRINPEVGLYINGRPNILKLDFNCKKESVLRKSSAKCMIALMRSQYSKDNNEYDFGIWDIRRNVIFRLDENDDLVTIEGFLLGEAKSFIQIRDSILNPQHYEEFKVA